MKVFFFGLWPLAPRPPPSNFYSNFYVKDRPIPFVSAAPGRYEILTGHRFPVRWNDSGIINNTQALLLGGGPPNRRGAFLVRGLNCPWEVQRRAMFRASPSPSRAPSGCVKKTVIYYPNFKSFFICTASLLKAPDAPSILAQLPLNSLCLLFSCIFKNITRKSYSRNFPRIFFNKKQVFIFNANDFLYNVRNTIIFGAADKKRRWGHRIKTIAAKTTTELKLMETRSFDFRSLLSVCVQVCY